MKNIKSYWGCILSTKDRLSVDLSTKINESKRKWNDIFKVMKYNKCFFIIQNEGKYPKNKNGVNF